MYIRKSSRVHNGKTYTNHVLVESVMTPKGPRQKTICSLGDLGPRPREDWLKLARKMEDALSGQRNLLDADAGELGDSVARVRARRPGGKLALRRTAIIVAATKRRQIDQSRPVARHYRAAS